ncbi:unnamed protein product [Parajaminaea phylloscopi]
MAHRHLRSNSQDHVFHHTDFPDRILRRTPATMTSHASVPLTDPDVVPTPVAPVAVTLDQIQALMRAQEERLQAMSTAQEERLRRLFRDDQRRSERLDDSAQAQARRAQADQRWVQNSVTQRRQAYLDAGLTEAQAEEALLMNPLQPVSHPTTIVQQPSRRYQVRVEDLHTFDGKATELEFWLARISSLHDLKQDPAWREQILETLPLCLRDSAAKWYQASSQTYRLTELSTWEGWQTQLRAAFAIDSSSARRLADKRVWDYRKEDVATYHYDKIALLRAAYPHRSDEDFVQDLWDGLPESLQMSTRTIMSNHPAPHSFLKEVRTLEGPWRGADPRNRRAQQVDETPAPNPKVEPGVAAPRQQSAQPAANRAGASRASLRETYNPANVKIIKGERFYTIPGTNKIIKLERPCNTCGGPHFSFEHDHMATRKTEGANFYQTGDTIEGYTVYLAADALEHVPGSPFSLSAGTNASTASLAITVSDGDGASRSPSPSPRFVELAEVSGN